MGLAGVMVGVRDGEVIGDMLAVITDLMRDTMLRQLCMRHLLSLLMRHRRNQLFWLRNHNLQFGITALQVANIIHMLKSAQLAGRLKLQRRQQVVRLMLARKINGNTKSINNNF